MKRRAKKRKLIQSLAERTRRVAIASVKPHPDNPRTHSEENISVIMESLREFGQQKPIVVDKDGFIIAGNGTFHAALKLGWDEIEAVRTELSSDQALAFGIVDNRSTDLSRFDFDRLAHVIRKINEAKTVDITVTGFKEFELRPLLHSYEPGEIEDLPKSDPKETNKIIIDIPIEVWTEVKARWFSDVPEGNEGKCVVRLLKSLLGMKKKKAKRRIVQ